MSATRLFRIVFPIFLFLCGFWFIGRPTTLTPENPNRQRVIQAVAPVQPDRPGNPWDGGKQTAVPVSIALNQIPPNVYDPNNQLDRWLRGEIDLEPAESATNEAALAALRQAALALEADADIQPAIGGSSGAILETQFDGLDYLDCCGGGGNVPPDAHLAVGPNHIVTVVNVAFAIYDKNGNLLTGPTTLASFLGANPHCQIVFDPNALYDEEADRFLLAADGNSSYYCLAVSQTADPTGQWHIYAFHTGAGLFDYPHAGVGIEALYMGGNIFAGGLFSEARIWAFDKWAMYYGLPATAVTHSLGSNAFSPQPLHLHGWQQGTWPESGPHYILAEAGNNGASVSVYAWDDPFGQNSLTTVGNADLNTATGVSAGMPINVPQSGGMDIGAGDWRPFDFEYRNGYAWTTMTVACNPGNGTVNCLRWAQIDPATAAVVQAGVYGRNSEYRFYPNLAVNHCDDIAIGYSKSSNAMFPAIWYTGRAHNDPLNTLQPEAEIKAGEVSYTAFDAPPYRWGDYTTMTIDPDGRTFWYVGQYSKNTGMQNGRWGTYIAAMRYPSCVVTPPPTPTPIPTVPPPPPTGHEVIYLSLRSNGTVGDISFADEDILAFDMETESWSFVLDGSDVGLSRGDVDAVAVLPDGRFLLSLDRPLNVPGLGVVDDADLIAFTPVSLGEQTDGTFEWYFDASDVGLTAVWEDIDALSLTADGRLLLSTAGSFSVSGAAGTDEDILAFSPTSLGAQTAGSWALYFDGSDVGLTEAQEDLWGAWLNPYNGNLYLTTQGDFSIQGLDGGGADIIKCEVVSLGQQTNCLFASEPHWRGSDYGLGEDTIDAFTIVP